MSNLLVYYGSCYSRLNLSKRTYSALSRRPQSPCFPPAPLLHRTATPCPTLALPYDDFCDVRGHVGDSSIFPKVIIPNQWFKFYSERFFHLRRVIIPSFVSLRVIVPKIFIPKGHYPNFGITTLPGKSLSE